jgi:hypothetical protein
MKRILLLAQSLKRLICRGKSVFIGPVKALAAGPTNPSLEP